MQWLLVLMQVSIVIPMVVVWRRRRYFPAPIRLLSWYVYLSAFCVLGARLLYPEYLSKNHWFLTGFNIGKIILFALVYQLVLESAWIRRLIAPVTMLAVAGIATVFWNDSLVSVGLSRTVQCALLASLAIAYLAQVMTRPYPRPTSQDPLWQLSIGQLIYSAGTATAFSLDLVPMSTFEHYVQFSFISVAGLIFNYFLTLAFLRAQPAEQATSETTGSSIGQFAQS
jgi:hypothetical protein